MPTNATLLPLCVQQDAPYFSCILQHTANATFHTTPHVQVDRPRAPTGSTVVGRCSFASHDAGRRVGPELPARGQVCLCECGGLCESGKEFESSGGSSNELPPFFLFSPVSLISPFLSPDLHCPLPSTYCSTSDTVQSQTSQTCSRHSARVRDQSGGELAPQAEEVTQQLRPSRPALTSPRFCLISDQTRNAGWTEEVCGCPTQPRYCTGAF